MARRLIWTEGAANDLQAIVAFIAADSPHYGALTAGRILSHVERLRGFPHSGRVVPEYGRHDPRELLWQQYRVVYRVTDDNTVILAVVHGARRLEDRLGDLHQT